MSPNAGGGGGLSHAYSCAQGAHINFRDLTPVCISYIETFADYKSKIVIICILMYGARHQVSKSCLLRTVSSIIYLSRVLCLSVCDCVCVSQFVSERSAILLVLLIKLTKETDGGFREGGITDGKIGD